jgi:hypothetical protein
MTPRAGDLTPEEQERRRAQLERLRERYETLMAEAKAQFDREMAEGKVVRVAGFIRRRKEKP